MSALGMDISGKAPTAEVGQYVRFSIWGWRPMAEYLERTAPGLAAKVEYLHSNDGDGLDAADSITLAEILETEILNGQADVYVINRNAALAALPDERCPYCTDTPGFRTWPTGVQPCNVCNNGHVNTPGRTRPWECSYGMEVEDIRRFAEFLRECGGFEIW